MGASEILPIDQMPDYRQDLRSVSVEFPTLGTKQTARHTEFVKDLLEYLSCEGDDLDAEDLEFLRSAQVAERKYWAWRYPDTAGQWAYAFVSEGEDGQVSMGCDSEEDLAIEQAILADYHGCY